MTDNYIKIYTDGKTSEEFSRDISSAICEIQKLLHEHRITDLDESQHYAFLILTNIQQQIIEGLIDRSVEGLQRNTI